MPKLPSYQDVQRVSPQVQRDPGLQIPVQAFESGSGIAARELAPGLQAVSQKADELRTEREKTELINARTRLLEFGETAMYDPDTGFLSKKGQSAIAAQGGLQKDAQDQIDAVAKGLSSDAQRKAFDPLAQHWAQGFSTDASRHVLTETERHADQSFESQVTMSNRTAAHLASSGNWDGVKDEWDAQKLVLESQSARKGLDGEGLTNLTATAKSGFHTGVTEQLVADHNLKDAKSYFDANKGEIDVKQQLHLEQLMRARRAQDTGEAKTLLQEKLQDGYAMAARGVSAPANFIPNELIDAAYPDKDVHAEQARRQVNLMYRYGTDVASLKTMNNDELQKFVTETRAPSASRPDQFSEEAKIQDALKVDAVKTIKERLTTPMTYAAQNKIGTVNPIDFTSPQSIASEIPNRVKTAYTMAHMYGSPLMPLEKEEAGAMGRYADSLSYDKKTAFFDSLYQSAKDPQAYQAIMQSIRPDSPVSANVGVLMGKSHEQQDGTAGISVPGLSNKALGIPEAPPTVQSRSVTTVPHTFSADETMDARSVATMIAKGEDLLNPMKADKQTDGKPRLFKMPPEEGLRDNWRNTVGDAYGGNREAEDHAYQSYRAFYAAAATEARAGDIAVDSNIAQKAARAVSGGISDRIGGQKVVLPWGMSEDDFYSKTQAQWPSIKDRIPNKNASFSDIKLMNAPADGWYIVYAGSGPVYDKRNHPIMIQVK